MADKLNETFSKENSTLNQIRHSEKEISSDTISDSVLKVSKLAIKDGFQVYKIIINLVKDAVMKSARIYIIFKRIEADGSQIISSEPSVEEIEKENFDKTVKLFIITKKSISEIENKISNVSEVESVSVEKLKPEEFQTTEISSIGSTLPSNSPVVQVLLTEIGNQTYALPISDIDRLISLETKNIKYIENVKVAVVEDEIIPLADMRDYFGDVKSSSSTQNVVIVERDAVKYGLIVDDFLKIAEVTVKTLGKIFKKKEFCGAIILQNDSIALMFNIPYLIESFSQILKINVDMQGEQHDVQPRL